MTLEGYDAFDDPYVYAGTDVLRNKLGITDAKKLENFELEMTTLSAAEPAPAGGFDASHYCAIHHHLFSHVYDWAGMYRTVRIAKAGNMFCFPEHIAAEMNKQFGRLEGVDWLRVPTFDVFVERVSDFLAELNAIHPFREGNGRCQLSFLALLAHEAGHELDLSRVTRDAFLPAMIHSYNGNLTPLKAQLQLLRV